MHQRRNSDVAFASSEFHSTSVLDNRRLLVTLYERRTSSRLSASARFIRFQLKDFKETVQIARTFRERFPPSTKGDHSLEYQLRAPVAPLPRQEFVQQTEM